MTADYVKVRGCFWVERGPLGIGWRARVRIEAAGHDTVRRTFWTWHKAKAQEILLAFQRDMWRHQS